MKIWRNTSLPPAAPPESSTRNPHIPTFRTAVATAALSMMLAVPALAQLGNSTTTPPPKAQDDAITSQDQTDDTTVQKVGTTLRHVSVIRQKYSQRAKSAGSPQQRQDLT